MLTATEPTTITAATVAATAQASGSRDAGRGLGASTVGSASRRAREARGKAGDGSAGSAQRVADDVVAHPGFEAVGPLQLPERGLDLGVFEITVHQARNLFSHHHLRSFSVPKSGRSSAAIASRARKIRERTVPTGQFITLAISS